MCIYVCIMKTVAKNYTVVVSSMVVQEENTKLPVLCYHSYTTVTQMSPFHTALLTNLLPREGV